MRRYISFQWVVRCRCDDYCDDGGGRLRGDDDVVSMVESRGMESEIGVRGGVESAEVVVPIGDAARADPGDVTVKGKAGGSEAREVRLTGATRGRAVSEAERNSQVVNTPERGIARARAKMEADGLPAAVITNFERLFKQVISGETGIIPEAEIEPLGEIDRFEEIFQQPEYTARGLQALGQLVVIRLNGGLGTTMGLDRAKSLLRVKGDLTFNDIIGHQLRSLRARYGATIPLIHMTSFSTDTDVRLAMEQYEDIRIDELPVSFLQHRHPKIYRDTLQPATESNEELNWNPPGHGDIYAALLASGLVDRLLSMGKRYVFVANADNLGATVEPSILGYVASTGTPFLMETAQRTVADAKGGHLARSRASGRVLLRETSQAPLTADGAVIPEFGDIQRYQHFNTNNIWFDLEAVARVAREHNGCIPLPLISNRKTVNPRDRTSRPVVQIETAMGAAIGVFEGARALQVPRSRFAPVKSNSDLLMVRSDLYELQGDYRLVINRARECAELPRVQLDSHHYGMIEEFEALVKVVPSLVRARSFVVHGAVKFNHTVKIEGDVVVSSSGSTVRAIPPNISEICDAELVL